MSVETLWLAMLGGFGLALPFLLWLAWVSCENWTDVAELFGFVIVAYSVAIGLLTLLVLAST